MEQTVDTSTLPVPNGALIRKDDHTFYFYSWDEHGLWELFEVDDTAIVQGTVEDFGYKKIHLMDYSNGKISSVVMLDMATESGEDARLCDEHPMTVATVIKSMMEKWFDVSKPLAPNITQTYVENESQTKH